MVKLLNEVAIFLILFVILALGMHMKEWISNPLDHLGDLSGSKFGLFHPISFAFAIYLVLFVLRKLFSFIVYMFMKKS